MLELVASGGSTRVESRPVEPLPDRRTMWGLRVPRALGVGDGREEELTLIESSPFYARLESTRGEAHALAEVADFERFHRRSVRWMAHFRTREGNA
jgi:hypothetical protein